MKKIIVFSLLLAGIIFSTCKKEEENNENGAGTLAAVGNNWNGVIGNEPINVTIASNNGGIASATIDIFGTQYTIKGKATTNEIADFVYSEGNESQPYTLVKFDANVGDEYVFTKGVMVVTRTVQEKNKEIYVDALCDTVPCFVVEEIIPEDLMLLGQPVVGSKIKYWINPTYGIVYAEVTPTWGAMQPAVLYSTNVGN
jgi:hypothetical protein